MEQRIFGRLLAFWQMAAPRLGLDGGIGFWQRKRGMAAAEQDAAERQGNAAGETAAKASTEKKYFWQDAGILPAESAERGWLLRQKAASAPHLTETEAAEQRRISDAPETTQTRYKPLAQIQAVDAAAAEQKAQDTQAGSRKRFFAAAFWQTDAKAAQMTEKSAGLQHFWADEPLAEKPRTRILPLGERVAEKAEVLPAVQAEGRNSAESREKPAETAAQAPDVDALMRQFAERLQEAREGASRRRYR